MNVFNDSSQSDTTGTLTSTSLTGLGLPGALNLGDGAPFGEPVRFAAGITYANIEELNIHLGSGHDTFTIESTHVGSTNVFGAAGNDTFLVKTISGHTTIESGLGDDKITVRNDEGIVDQIAALLTLHTGAGADLVIVDDAADTNDNTGTLTGSTLTGLDMPTPPLTQVISIQAAGGRYRLERTDTHSFVELAFDATADQVATALRALFDTPDLKVTMDRIDGSVTYTVTFIREAASQDFAALAFRDVSQLVAAVAHSVSVNAVLVPRAVPQSASSRRSRWPRPAAPTGCTSSAATRSRASCATTSPRRSPTTRARPTCSPPSRRSWTRTTGTRCCRTPATSPSAATAASTGSCSAARTRRRRSAGSTRARSPARSRSPRAWTASTTTASRRSTSTSAPATTSSTSRARRPRPTSHWPTATSASTCPRAPTTASRTTPTTSTATSTRSSARSTSTPAPAVTS